MTPQHQPYPALLGILEFPAKIDWFFENSGKIRCLEANRAKPNKGSAELKG
jgi:hypothetical protein